MNYIQKVGKIIDNSDNAGVFIIADSGIYTVPNATPESIETDLKTLVEILPAKMAAILPESLQGIAAFGMIDKEFAEAAEREVLHKLPFIKKTGILETFNKNLAVEILRLYCKA